MKFLTLSEKEIKSTLYNRIQDKHIVISITSEDSNEIIIPPNRDRISQLHLKFDDVSDITEKFLFFTRAQAIEILEFVEKYINQVSLIIVQCQAGLSRSVAVAAALSKIINYTDDGIYTRGIPNMFVYTTLLDTFFSNPNWIGEFPKVTYRRNQAMSQFLTPATVRLNAAKERKRLDV